MTRATRRCTTGGYTSSGLILSFFHPVSRSSLFFNNYSATMTSLNVAPQFLRSSSGSWTNPERGDGSCTVQSGWCPFDPNILHAGCVEARSARAFNRNRRRPPSSLFLSTGPLTTDLVLALLQIPEIHLIFSGRRWRDSIATRRLSRFYKMRLPPVYKHVSAIVVRRRYVRHIRALFCENWRVKRSPISRR